MNSGLVQELYYEQKLDYDPLTFMTNFQTETLPYP